MPLLSVLRERSPPGGSGYSGFFDKQAFKASVYPKGRHLERDGTQKLQLREHRDFCAQPAMLQAASVEYTLDPEVQKRNRLRRACGEQLRRLDFNGQRLASLGTSSSAPSIGVQGLEEKPEVRGASSGTAEYLARPSSRPSSQGLAGPLPGPPGSRGRDEELWEEEEEEPALMPMNTRWYPHVCANRGTLKLTGPAAMLRGIDPAKDKAHECPFWEADKHRFAAVAALPEAKPRTPTKSLRWRSDAAWNDPANQTALKVTQTLRPLKA